MSKRAFDSKLIPQRLRAGRLLSCVMLAVATATIMLSSTGCNVIRTFDETAALTYRDFVWSKRAYNLRYGNCNRPYEEHFRNGFCAGYEDICDGGDGYVPALPPDDYRSYEFQSTDGARCVSAWFEGYPAGVAAARQDKAGSYHDVMISRMINDAVKQDKTNAKLPSDINVVDGQQKRSEPFKIAPGTAQPVSITPVNPMPSVVEPVNESKPFTLSVEPPMVPANFKLPTPAESLLPGSASSNGFQN